MAVLPSGYTYLQTLEDGVLRKLYTAARHDGVSCLCEEVFVGPPLRLLPLRFAPVLP